MSWVCSHLKVLTSDPRYIHPEGLPSDYTISMLFRLLPETPEEPFALWEILNKDNEPLVGVILDSELLWDAMQCRHRGETHGCVPCSLAVSRLAPRIQIEN